VSMMKQMTRGATALPPAGYEVIRYDGRYYPVRLHLDDPVHRGATAFTRADGRIVSYAKRTFAVLYLYQMASLIDERDLNRS
jgi:hypothetical protein